MSPGVALLFWSFVLFEVKHFVYDFVLQTAYQYRNKGIYGHPAGFVHAGLHAAGSLPAVLILTETAWLAAAVLSADFLVHYHTDWLKKQITKRKATTAQEGPCWGGFSPH